MYHGGQWLSKRNGPKGFTAAEARPGLPSLHNVQDRKCTINACMVSQRHQHMGSVQWCGDATTEGVRRQQLFCVAHLFVPSPDVSLCAEQVQAVPVLEGQASIERMLDWFIKGDEVGIVGLPQWQIRRKYILHEKGVSFVCGRLYSRERSP